MAEDRMAVLETVRKAIAEGDVDFLREGMRVLAQAVMEAEVTELTGVPKGERDPEHRLTSRNGWRERRWDTRLGTLELSIPRVRDGSYFPSLLEPRRRAERALLAVVQEAYVLGVSTRRVDDLVEALGIASLSRSEVSRICAALDAEVEAFRTRPLGDKAYPYLWLDATVRHEAPHRPSGRQEPAADLSQQVGEAEGSLTPETRGSGGSSPDNDGTGRHRQTARVRQARRRGARRLNQWWNPLKRGPPARNLVDLGRSAAGRSSKLPATGSGWARYPSSRRPRRKPAAYPWRRLQGKSWAPPPSIGREVNVGTNPEPPTLPRAAGRRVVS